MLKLLAILSSRLKALLELPQEVEEVFVAVALVLDKYSQDPDVQRIRNEVADVRKKIAEVRGK